MLILHPINKICMRHFIEPDIETGKHKGNDN